MSATAAPADAGTSNIEPPVSNAEERWIETVKIAAEKIRPSPTNPRKRFNPEKQSEMEASMRAHGFTLSTLLVRPMVDGYYIDSDEENQLWTLCRRTVEGVIRESNHATPSEARTALERVSGCFELVAGERRFRAACAVGIKEMPCLVQQLSDQEVLEIQLVENLQRDDLTAIEEAMGFRRMLDLRDAEGHPLHTCASLAAKIGKSVRHVERRAKLCVLAQDGELAEVATGVEDGTLPPKTALLIARIPDPKLRLKAVKAILHPQYEVPPLPYRRAEELIQREFMADLRSAEFDQKDAVLVSIETDENGERCGGGACTDCPLKVGNAKELFEDEVPSGLHNMCMNPGCFAKKERVAWERWQEKETDPAKKRRALSEKESRTLYRYGDQLEWNSAYVDLKERPDGSDLKSGIEAPGTWRQLTKGAELEVIVAKDRNGRVHELVNRELAIQAAETLNKHKIFRAKPPASSSGGGQQMSEEDRKAVAKKQKEEQEIEEAVVTAVLAEVAAKTAEMKDVPQVVLSRVVTEYLQNGENGMIVCERRGAKFDYQAIPKLTGKLTRAELISWLCELTVAAEVEDDGWRGGNFRPLISALGIDDKAIEKRVKAERAAAVKARVELAPGLAWIVGPTEEFEFNKSGVCEAPDELELSFPKSLKLEVRIYVAKSEKGWHGGCSASFKTSSHSASPRNADHAHATRLAAVLDEVYGVKGWLAKEADGAPLAALGKYLEALLAMTKKDQPAKKGKAAKAKPAKNKGGAK